MFKIVRGIASSQSKGCWLFIQVGCTAFVLKQLWGKPRDVALVHAEIDTPYHPLCIGVYLWKKKGSRRYRGFHHNFQLWIKPNKRAGNGYRDRWLRKCGYEVKA